MIPVASSTGTWSRGARIFLVGTGAPGAERAAQNIGWPSEAAHPDRCFGILAGRGESA